MIKERKPLYVTVEVMLSDDIAEDTWFKITQWFAQKNLNISHYWTGSAGVPGSGKRLYRFLFKDHELAMLFKLTWGGE